MNTKPLDIVSMIDIIIVVSSSAISMYIVVKADKEQKAQKEKDSKAKKGRIKQPRSKYQRTPRQTG